MKLKRVLILLAVIALLFTATPVLALGVWTTSPPNAPLPAPFNREGACIALSSAPDVGGVSAARIYVIAGFGPGGDSTTNSAYDVGANTWNVGTLAPIPGVPRSEGAAVSRSGFIYCLGGRFGTTLNNNQRYDPATDTWVTLAPMPVPVASEYSAVVVGKEIHVIGGRTGSGTVPFSAPKTDVHQVYHIGKNTWTTEAPLPGGPRSEMVAVAKGNKIHVFGGNVVPFGAAVATHDVYDVAKNAWSVGPPMLAPRANAAAGVLGNSIYVIGGKASFGGALTTTVQRFDIDKGTWSFDTPKPNASAETVGISHGGEIFVIGGGFFGSGSGVIGTRNESFRPTPP